MPFFEDSVTSGDDGFVNASRGCSSSISKDILENSRESEASLSL